MCGYPQFSSWIPTALAEVFFFHMVQIRVKDFCLLVGTLHSEGMTALTLK